MKKLLLLVACAGMLCACTATNPRVSNHIDITGVDFTDDSLKVGKDCSTYILGLFGPFGSTNIIKASKKGNIKQAAYVDYQASYFILAGQECVVVYGK